VGTAVLGYLNESVEATLSGVWSRWPTEPLDAPADGWDADGSHCSWPATTPGCTPPPGAACPVCRSWRRA